MKIVICSSELNSVASSGGLGVAVEQLAKAYSRRRHQVMCMTPRYMWTEPSIKLTDTWKSVQVPVWRYGTGNQPDFDTGLLFETTLPGSHVKTILIGNERHFGRPDLYAEDGQEYPDNEDRFAFFSQAVLRACGKLGFIPDLIHAHDWQTGSLPLFMRDLRHLGGHRVFDFLDRTKVLWTFHNLHFHGPRPEKAFMARWGLSESLFQPDRLLSVQHEGRVDFVKAPIIWSDAVSTVSGRYLIEILQDRSEKYWNPVERRHDELFFASGMRDALRWAIANKPVAGILNGLDECSPWDDDTLGDQMFDAHNFTEKKTAIKRRFQQDFGFEDKGDNIMLVGFSGRFDMQKGGALLPDVVRMLSDRGPLLHLIVYDAASAGTRIDHMLRQMQADFPRTVRVVDEYRPGFRNKLWAAEDAYLMPSLFEPCGLAHRQAAHYGGLMITRWVGGLAETVTDIGDPRNPNPHGNGILFGAYNADELYHAICRAHDIYVHHNPLFRDLQHKGIGMDDSWDRVVTQFYEPFLERVLQKDLSANPRY